MKNPAKWEKTLLLVGPTFGSHFKTAGFLFGSPFIFGIMDVAVDEPDLGEVLGLMADYVIDISHHHIRGEFVSRGRHMAAAEILLPEPLPVYRSIFPQIEYI